MAIIYVDSLAGNDANPGTLAAPKATPRGAFLIHNAFDEISFKAGRCYAPYNGFFPRFTKNGVKVTAYGLTSGADKWTDYPVWDGLTYENSGATGWVHEGSGVWSKTFANAKAKRIWFGANNSGVLTTQRTIGTAYRRTPGSVVDDITAIKAALDSTDRWHPSGSALGYKLYVYTGSTTVNPPTFYGGLAILICDAATIGAEEGLYATKVTGCRANNIHIRGAHGDSGIVCSNTTDTLATDDIIYENCISSCNGVANVWAIRTKAADSNPRKVITNSYLKNIEADSKSSTYEQDPDTNYGHISSMDMFVITGNCNNCHIWDFKATNSAHVGAAMGGAIGSEPVNCSILRGYIKFDSWVTYGRGIATAKMTNSLIGECIIDGQNVRSQFADGWIVGNKWINMRASIRKAFTDDWAAIECYVYDYGGATTPWRYETRKPADLLIANNFVDRPIATPGANPFLITTYGSSYPVAEPNPTIDLNTVRIYNNIIVLSEARTWLGCYVNGGAIYDQLIKNNIIYTSGGADATVRWQSGTLVGMNVKPGHVGNLNVNPMLDAGHKPTTGSPAIAAGLPIGSGFKDLAGVTFSSTTPSIGAYEVAPPPVEPPPPPPPPPPIPVSGIINDRDVMMQAASMRHESVNTRAILLSANIPVFKVSNTGTPTPSSITFTAKLFGVAGIVTFAADPAVTLTTSGNTATLTYANMGANTSVKVTATLEYGGVTFTSNAVDIAKVLDGTNGTNGTSGTSGQRGTLDIATNAYTYPWSDAEYTAAIQSVGVGGPFNRDRVTMYDAAGNGEIKFYNNGSWIIQDHFFHGNVLIENTLAASSLVADEMVGLVYKTSTGSTRVAINESSNNALEALSSGTVVARIGGAGLGGGYVYASANASFTAAVTGKQAGAYAATEGYCTHATLGAGVYGNATGTSSTGVQGIADGSSANGVAGSSSAGTGVKGSSSGAGVGGSFSSSTGNALEITAGANAIVQTGGGASFMKIICPSVDNSWTLGASGFRWTQLHATSSTIATSDIRTKTNVLPSNLGLSFVNDLNPISYTQVVAENIVTDNWVEVEPERQITDDYGDLIIFPAVIKNQPIIEPRAGKRRHYGFPAQHIREMLLKHEAPEAAIWTIEDVNDPESLQGLRYEELVPVLTKAIQELSAERDAMRSELDQLKLVVNGLLEAK